MPRLVLASTSPYRRLLLERLRVPFTCRAPGVDEAATKATSPHAFATATGLARQKAQAIAALEPDAIVIGSDQCAALGDEVLDKPGTTANAIDQLLRLQGREHRLLTAVAIAHPRGLVEFVDTTRLTMRQLDRAAIERYVAAEQPLDCAGSYKIEGLGIALFAAIASADQTAIMGLPLLRLTEELRGLGFTLP